MLTIRNFSLLLLSLFLLTLVVIGSAERGFAQIDAEAVEGEARTTYDLKEYMISDSSYPSNKDFYSISISDNTQDNVQLQQSGNRWYFVKNGQWEELWFDNNYIWRGRDTSEDDNKWYALYQNSSTGVTDWGDEWAPRTMYVTQTFDRTPYVRHYWESSCVMHNQGSHSTTLELIKHEWSRPINGKTFNDVIHLQARDTYANSEGEFEILEDYYYAKGIGLVEWKEYTGSNRSSHFNVWENGADIQRESVCTPGNGSNPTPTPPSPTPTPPPSSSGLPTGTYKIIAQHSNSCIGLENPAYDNDGNVVPRWGNWTDLHQWDSPTRCPNNLNGTQKWQFVNIGGGDYLIKNVWSNNQSQNSSTPRCTSPEIGTGSPWGTQVHQWKCNNKDTQKWRLELLNGNKYRIRNKIHSNFCWDIHVDGGNPNGDKLELYSCWSDPWAHQNQIFEISTP